METQDLSHSDGLHHHVLPLRMVSASLMGLSLPRLAFLSHSFSGPWNEDFFFKNLISLILESSMAVSDHYQP